MQENLQRCIKPWGLDMCTCLSFGETTRFFPKRASARFLFSPVSGDGVQETWVPCTGLKVKRNIAPDPFMDDGPHDLSRRGVSSVARSDNFCLHSMLTEPAASLKWRRKAVWIDLLPCSNQALGAQVFGGEVYKPGRRRIC